MKKRLVLVLAAASAMGSLGMFAAHADQVTTKGLPTDAVGYATVDTDGARTVTLDGAQSNPDPLGGYLIINSDGSVDCGDNAAVQPDDTDPNHTFQHGCNPSVPGM